MSERVYRPAASVHHPENTTSSTPLNPQALEFVPRTTTTLRNDGGVSAAGRSTSTAAAKHAACRRTAPGTSSAPVSAAPKASRNVSSSRGGGGHRRSGDNRRQQHHNAARDVVVEHTGGGSTSGIAAVRQPLRHRAAEQGGRTDPRNSRGREHRGVGRESKGGKARIEVNADAEQVGAPSGYGAGRQRKPFVGSGRGGVVAAQSKTRRILPRAGAAAAFHIGPAAGSGGGRLLASDDQRRRNSRDDGVLESSTKLGGDEPGRMLHAKSAAHARAGDRSNSTARSRRRGRAATLSHLSSDCATTLTSTTFSLSRTALETTPSGSSVVRDSSKRPSELSLLEELKQEQKQQQQQQQQQEDAFPALPAANGGRMPLSPPISSTPVAGTTTQGMVAGPSYSLLADRLAVEAARAKALAEKGSSRTSLQPEGEPVEGFLTLSVLPGFGDDREDQASRWEGREGGRLSDSESQALAPSSKTELGGDAAENSMQAMASPSSALPPSPPPPKWSIATGSGEQRNSSASASLRARLRERWFRLEAMKKAERQREASERGLMATEDDSLLIVFDRYNDRRSLERRRQRLVPRPQKIESVGRVGGEGDSDDDSGSNSGSSGSEDGGGAISGDDESGSLEGLRVSGGAPLAVTAGKGAVTASPPRGNCSSSCNGSSDIGVSSVRCTGVREEKGPCPASKPMSAAGAAAIKRSEAAAADGRLTTTTTTCPSVCYPSNEQLQGAASCCGACVGSSDVAGVSIAQGAPSMALATPGSISKDDGGNGTADGRLCHSDDAHDEGGGRDSHRVAESHGERVHAACEAGMAGLLNDLLVRSGGRAADGKDKLRRTPLHLAAEAGALECVNLLLKQGTRLDQRDRWRETPLHKAARSGNPDIVKTLCTARMKVNVRNRHRETPLLLAVRADSVDAVAALLSFGARLDDPDVSGVTPVCQAAMSGQADLLMAMANSNQACRTHSNRSSRESTVHFASTAGQPSFRSSPRDASLRRTPGAAVHCGGSSGEQGGRTVPALSPIHEAAGAGQAETLSLLLQIGLSLEERDAAAGVMGDTPLGRAVRGGRLDCARLLLDAGAMIGRENARGETPLVVAIRAGQASAVELLAKRGAALDGGRSAGRLTSSDGRAPAGAREKMMARRRVEPLELALREGQLACAAVLIESGTRITQRALRVIKLEPTMSAVPTDRSPAPGAQVKYAGTDAGVGSGNANGPVSTPIATTMLSLQTDLVGCISPEILETAASAPVDGSGLFEEERGVDDAGGVILTGDRVGGVSGRRRPAARARGQFGGAEVEKRRGETRDPAMEEVVEVEYVGGLSRALGECDAVLVLYDGSRLPVHACLLAAFSGACRELFVGSGGRRVRHRRRHRGCRNDRCVCFSCGDRRTKKRAQLAVVETPSPEFGLTEASDEVEAPPAPGVATASGGDRCARAREVHAMLTGYSIEAHETGQQDSTSSSNTVEGQVSVAAWAVISAAEDGWRRQQSPAVLEWGPVRGEVFVRFWGAGTMAAVVKHVYSGRPPSENANPEGLTRLLAAAASLRMPRLMRQVEHLLSATLLPQQKGAAKLPAQHAKIGKLLRAARAVGAQDLENRCTLYLQTNGRFPTVMKLRRGLKIPSLNASDVTRGLAILNGSGYLGSGPAHAWSSVDSSASASVATAKRSVDLSLRKRGVDFDGLVPLLLDPARCLSTLSIGRQERAILLKTALADACSGENPGDVFCRLGEENSPQPDRHRFRVCCDAITGDNSNGNGHGCVAVGNGPTAIPLVSNLAAFSHGVGWLLRTGAVADVALVLRTYTCTEDVAEGNGVAHQGVAIGRGEGNEIRFLAHSLVLGARSEKFAAMLRFVRRQDDQGCTDDDYDGGLDGEVSDCDVSSDDYNDSCCGCGVGVGGGGVTGAGIEDIPGDVNSPVSVAPLGAPGLQSAGKVQDKDTDFKATRCSDGCCSSQSQVSHRQCRPRRHLPPRELELHSPLLSPRSLGLFLEFLYTGVLNPGLSAGELSELALVADEYLVPDLMWQAEALLVECLTSLGVGDFSPGGSTQPTGDDKGSMPLEVLQLGVSLGLRTLSVAAARAVLLQLETVSRSEAFEASGMTKRDLVIAALEAARS